MSNPAVPGTPMSLADMIVPSVFYHYTQQYSTINTDFWTSGIVKDMSALIGDLGGSTVNFPFFNPLAGDTVVIDDTQDLQVRKTSTGKEVAAALFRAFAYGSTDLSGDLAGADPMLSIMNGIGQLWSENIQRDLLAVLAGAMGSLAAEGKNTLDLTKDSSGTPVTGRASVFDGYSMLDAKQTLGDRGEALAAIAVHSSTKTLMEKQDLIDFIPHSESGRPIPYYMGKRVIVTDQMPTTGTGKDTVYTSYLFGPGSIGYAEKPTKKPVGVDRNELVNMGEEFIATRRHYAIHPFGVKWQGTPALSTPSNTELATPGNWARTIDPKLIRVVQLRHRNAY